MARAPAKTTAFMVMNEVDILKEMIMCEMLSKCDRFLVTC